MQYIFLSIDIITIDSNNFSLFVYGAAFEFYGKYPICMYIYAGLFFPSTLIHLYFLYLFSYKNRILNCLDKRKMNL